MKYQLSITILLLIGYLLSNCSGQKKLKTRASNDEINPVTEEVHSKTLNHSTVTDIEGNVYPVVMIGDKLWMAANLNVSKYNNGTPILPYSGGGFLEPLKKGMFTYYNKDMANKTRFGKLYNYHAVTEGCLCPEGWQVPTDEDWQEVIKLQKQDKLNLLLGGLMNPQDIPPFSDMDISGYWWTTTSVGRNTVATYEFHLDKTSLQKSGMNERNFLSVRCIKN
ncbi:MAG: fibrobacter succinogenes major paralogous domain-containing protein [Bacteroidales bacterium]|nr:fibrobacter succinogenes major paralogous domain-containing protein [Bacteroidales bacterium]